MKNPHALWLVAIVAGVVLYGCGTHKERPFVAVVGGDTLTAATFTALRPDTTADPTRTEQIVLQVILAAHVADSATRRTVDSLQGGFGEQLSLRTGGEWNAPGAGSLLLAGLALQEELLKTPTPADFTRRIDSLYRFGAVFSTGQAVGTPSQHIPSSLTTSAGGNDSLAPYATALLGVDPKTARILADYVRALSQPDTSRADMQRMVKNLVADRNVKPQAPPTSADSTVPAPADNSELVLKYRSQESISDTIKRRQDEIKALYRKYLKMNSAMAGTVQLEMRVDPPGTVISAQVSASTIGDSRFLEAFRTFARTITFKPVPANVGNMTFVYPFEFSPEE